MRGITHSLSHWPVTLSIRLARPNVLTQFARPAHSLALSSTHSPRSLTLSPTHSLAHSLTHSLTCSPNPPRSILACTHAPTTPHSLVFSTVQCRAVPQCNPSPGSSWIDWLAVRECVSADCGLVDWSIGGWLGLAGVAGVGRQVDVLVNIGQSANRPIARRSVGLAAGLIGCRAIGVPVRLGKQIAECVTMKICDM